MGMVHGGGRPLPTLPPVAVQEWTLELLQALQCQHDDAKPVRRSPRLGPTTLVQHDVFGVMPPNTLLLVGALRGSWEAVAYRVKTVKDLAATWGFTVEETDDRVVHHTTAAGPHDFSWSTHLNDEPGEV